MAAAESRFHQLRRAGKLLEVLMNDALILLPGSAVAAIGTQNLNGCTAIVVLGRAIILGHIAPLPPVPEGSSAKRAVRPDEGDAHFHKLMDKIRDLYTGHRSHFPDQTTAWGIFGLLDGRTMREKEAIAIQRFGAMGLPHKHIYYEVQKASLRTNPAAGQAFGILSEASSWLYVEDKPIKRTDFSVPKTVTPASAASSSVEQRALPTSTAIPSTSSNVQTQPGFWAWSSRTQQWAFVAHGKGQRPKEEWPEARGRSMVFCTDDQKWRQFDFDTGKWV